jgi:hypothetical protein
MGVTAAAVVVAVGHSLVLPVIPALAAQAATGLSAFILGKGLI